MRALVQTDVGRGANIELGITHSRRSRRPQAVTIALGLALVHCHPYPHAASRPAGSTGPRPPPLPARAPSWASACPGRSGRDYVEHLRISTDGSRVLAHTRAHESGSIEVWDLDSGKLVLRTPAFAGYSSFDFAEGRASVVTSFRDATKLFRLQDGKELAAVTGAVDAVSAVRRRPASPTNGAGDGASGASWMAVSTPRAVEVRSTADGSLASVVERGQAGISDVRFVGDGLLLASTKQGSKLWRIPDGHLLKAFDVTIDSVSRSGRILFNAQGPTLRAWRLPDLVRLQPIRFEGDVLSVEADASDSMLLVSTSKFAYQIPVMSLIEGTDEVVSAVQSDTWQRFPARAHFTITTQSSEALFETPLQPDFVTENESLWLKINSRDVGRLQCVACLATDGLTVWTAAFDGLKVWAPELVFTTTFGGSHDGKVLAVAAPTSESTKSEIWIWRIPTVAAIFEVDATAFDLALAPDASKLVAAFNDGSIRVWAPLDGRFLGCLPGE